MNGYNSEIKIIRKIIHVDMDAFYASVEQMDNPSLRGKPVAVGGNAERGVVAAASYEARKFGVHSAMPSKIAARNCPDLIFTKARFDRYKQLSDQIRSIFFEYTDLVEPLSLDEAYLDVTENKKGISTATDIAIAIKKQIKEEVGLTASAGVSVNKFLAKIASDYNKPDGLYIIKPHQINPFIQELPIDKFFGVGKKTAEKMHRMGIYNGRDLQRWTLKGLVKTFGKQGRYFYNVARGEDNRRVNPNRIRKSVGAENTFSESSDSQEELWPRMEKILSKCWSRYENSKKLAYTASLKVKFDDFKQITRSKTVETEIRQFEHFRNTIKDLFYEEVELDNKVRLLGCSLSNFKDVEKKRSSNQLTLEL